MAVSYLVLISICKLFEQVPFGFCFHRCSVVRWNVYFLLPYSRLQGTVWISCMCYCGTWTPSPCPHHLWLLLFQNAWFFKIQSIITMFPTFFPLKRVWILLARNLCFDPCIGAYTRIYQIWVHLSFFSMSACFINVVTKIVIFICMLWCLRKWLCSFLSQVSAGLKKERTHPCHASSFFSGDLMFLFMLCWCRP
jgi:hypothetical protein